MASTTFPDASDPWTQPITLFTPQGDNFTISVDDFNLYRVHMARQAINYGSQIGASIVLLLVLLLLTRSEKRKSFIFLINASCLTINSIRCILLGCYMTSSMWNPYSQMTRDFTRVTKAEFDTNTATNVMTLILTILIMLSLSLQVHVVCVTTMPVQRHIITAVTSLIACIATGLKAAFCILTIKQTLALQTLERYKYIMFASYVSQAVSIWVFSFVFTYKLGYAILQRRKLNMPQFGPMQIVFIMGCQTMMIPAIFSILQFEPSAPELGQQVLTVVCIFLPLSAIWAGVANESVQAGPGPNSHNRLIQGEFYKSRAGSSATSSSGSTKLGSGRQLSVCTCSPAKKERQSAASTPSPRGKSEIRVGTEFGFSRGDDVERV